MTVKISKSLSGFRRCHIMLSELFVVQLLFLLKGKSCSYFTAASGRWSRARRLKQSSLDQVCPDHLLGKSAHLLQILHT